MRNILDEENLIDLGHSSPHFTWINRRGGSRLIKERLDRGEANFEWNFLIPNACIGNYIMGDSNHFLIILDTCPIKSSSPCPFRFEWMWMSHPGCGDQVQKC